MALALSRITTRFNTHMMFVGMTQTHSGLNLFKFQAHLAWAELEANAYVGNTARLHGGRPDCRLLLITNSPPP